MINHTILDKIVFDNISAKKLIIYLDLKIIPKYI